MRKLFYSLAGVGRSDLRAWVTARTPVVIACGILVAFPAALAQHPRPRPPAGSKPSAAIQAPSATKTTPGKASIQAPTAAPNTTPSPEMPPPRPPTPEEMPPNPPEVTYQDGQLSIMASNSTLSDILKAVRAAMGSDIEIPAKAGRERIVAQLGPGPAREVLSSLLGWTDFDYLIQASDDDPNGIRSVLLTPRSKGNNAVAGVNSGAGQPPSLAPRRSGPGTAANRPPDTRASESEALSETAAEEQGAPAEQQSVTAGTPNGQATAVNVNGGDNSTSAAGQTASSTAQAIPSDAQPAQADLKTPSSSDADSGRAQASASQRLMQDLQSMYEERRRMVEDSRKSPGQN